MDVGLMEMVDQSRETPKVVDPREVALRMKLDYSRGVKDQTTRYLQTVCELIWKLERSDLDVDAFITDTAETVMKVFGMESVAIAVRDPADRRYRYKVVVGLEKEIADAFKALSYTREDLTDSTTYPGHDISSRTRLFLAEEHPFAKGEEFTYRRPGLIGMRRRTIADSLEEDYIDFFFYGSDGDISGFIETSGTRLRRLPDSIMVRWIELIAGILGVATRKRT